MALAVRSSEFVSNKGGVGVEVDVQLIDRGHAIIWRGLAQGESVIKYESPLNVLKDSYDHS
jgi:hypothetical protein